MSIVHIPEAVRDVQDDLEKLTDGIRGHRTFDSLYMKTTELRELHEHISKLNKEIKDAADGADERVRELERELEKKENLEQKIDELQDDLKEANEHLSRYTEAAVKCREMLGGV